MLDLDTQIRLYLDATTRPIDVDDLAADESPIVPPTTLPRPTIQRRWLVAAAAAVAVIIAFALPLFLNRPATPTITQPTPPTLPLDQQPLSELFDLTDWIAATQEVGNEWVVALIHPDGTGRLEVGLQGEAGNGILAPDWSPDGKRLVVERSIPGASELGEFDLESGATSQLWPCGIASCKFENQASYSPDGEELAFVGTSYTGDGFSCGIRIRDIASGGDERVKESCYVAGPRWSPDGSKLVYSQSDGTASNQGVYVINLDDRQAMQITDSELNGGKPDWSPDGDWIVFCSNANYAYGPNNAPPGGNLYRVRPDGSDLEQLTFLDLATPGACEPRYTPDGNWIVFTVNNEIWVMSSDGGDTRVLLTDGTYSSPDWQP